MDRNWAATGCQLACIDREATNTPRHTRCMLCCGIRTRHQGGRCEFPLCYRSHCFCGADGDGTSSLMSREKSGLRPAALARSAIWGALPQIRERQTGIERAALIGVFGKISIDDEPPVEWDHITDGPHHLDDGRRAVGRDRVVEFRRRGKCIGILHILEQQRAGGLRRRSETIDLDIFATKVRSHPDHIALIRRYDHQRIALEEVGNWRKRASDAPLHLHRPGDIVAALEAELRITWAMLGFPH